MSDHRNIHWNPAFLVDEKDDKIHPNADRPTHPLATVHVHLSSDNLTKALVSEFLWHYNLLEETIQNIKHLSDYQIQTKIHFTTSQLLILKRKYNIDIV
jgi:hypothetical protein